MGVAENPSTPPAGPCQAAAMYEEDEVIRVLKLLGGAGCEVWVAGGWGVDALLGRATREHGDLDLLHRAEQEPVVMATLERAGYSEVAGVSPGRPVRFVMADGAGRQLDLHPLSFGPDGSATQPADDRGGVFRYPAGCFVTGAIGGAVVGCLSVARQLAFHQGYEPRDRDLHDLAELHRAFGAQALRCLRR